VYPNINDVDHKSQILDAQYLSLIKRVTVR